MKLDDLLLTNQPCGYVGYVPSSICDTSWSLPDLSIFRQLKRIPPKISAFFDRSKIKAVFKSDCMADKLDDYYLIQTTDDTIFHVDY
jgi:hypothetical protein